MYSGIFQQQFSQKCSPALIKPSHKWLKVGPFQPVTPFIHAPTKGCQCGGVLLFRQGHLVVIIYEAWSRSITTDGKSWHVCLGWGIPAIVNPETLAHHQLPVDLDQSNQGLLFFSFNQRLTSTAFNYMKQIFINSLLEV